MELKQIKWKAVNFFYKSQSVWSGINTKCVKMFDKHVLYVYLYNDMMGLR